MKNVILKFIYFILASYARKVIKRHRPFVIGITGSVGKTSTKEAIFSVLNGEFKGQVRKTAGNLNAEIGIPLTILGYDRVPSKFFWPFFLLLAYFRMLSKSYPKYLVLEMGVEHKGDIRYFASIVEPNVGVITSTAPVHIQNFAGKEELILEKKTLLETTSGKVIVNGDDPGLSRVDDERVVIVGIDNERADIRGTRIALGPSGTSYWIETTGHKLAVKTKLLGRAAVYSQLFAFAIGQLLGIQSLKIKSSLEKIPALPGRLNLITGKEGMTLLDDTYNASPASMKLALDLLFEIKHKGRKVAILGNMNELGSYEKEAHAEVGRYTKGRCDLAVFVGKNSGLMAEAFADEKNCRMFKNRLSLLQSIGEILLPDDLVLIKASQNGNFLEEVTKHLMANPKEAKNLLVRQSDWWLRKK